MRSNRMTFAAVAGGVVAAVAALVFLTGGGAEARSAKGSPIPRDRAGSAAARPRPAYAYGSAEKGTAHHGPASASADASDPVAARARDLLARIEAAVGPKPELPAELQREILDFLAGGEAHRTALFALAWEPSTPRMVLGHLRLFLNSVADAETRRVLLAAFDAADPRAADRAAVAARAKDPSLLVATLRATANPKERAQAILALPEGARTEPVVAAWLLETARDDADEDVRGHAYTVLAVAGSRDSLPVITAAAGDPGRSVKERQRAAFAMGILPHKAPLADLFRIYENSPDEVRRNLLASFAVAPADRRVDDLLLEVLGAASTSDKTRKAAATALEARLGVLTAAEARDLGARTAEVVKALDSEKAVLALNSLGGAVVANEPLREAVRELERTAPAGGAIQLAMVNLPSLRFALGRN